MCLILADWNTHDEYLLVVAANRDEFHGRASLPADWWTDHKDIYGGRDLQAKGTWLAVNRLGHFAAVTNVRKLTDGGSRSRGGLAVSFLRDAKIELDEYVNNLKLTTKDYDGYNFLAFDGTSLQWFNNVENVSRTLKEQVFALSNASLDTPWPKVERVKAEYLNIRAGKDNTGTIFVERLFGMLADRYTATDEQLPDTGVGIALERQLAPIFIEGDNYGTRCSTIFTLTRAGSAQFVERRFDQAKKVLGESRIEFEIN